MQQEKISTQEWIPIEKIFDNGIIKLKNKNYIIEQYLSIAPDRPSLCSGWTLTHFIIKYIFINLNSNHI